MAEIGLNDAKAHQNIGKKNNPVTNIARKSRAILQGLESSINNLKIAIKAVDRMITRSKVTGTVTHMKVALPK